MERASKFGGREEREEKQNGSLSQPAIKRRYDGGWNVGRNEKIFENFC